MTGRFVAGWRQVAACMVLMGSAAMIASAYSVVAVPLGREFGPSRMVLMLSMTVLSGVSAVVSPLFGSMMDRLPMRLLTGAGAALLVAGFVALSFATSFSQVLVVYGVLMAPANILLGPMIATVLLSRWFVARRGAVLGIAIAGIAAGNFIYPPLIQALFDHYDWRIALRLLAVILMFLTVPAVAMIVNRPADVGLQPDGVQAPSANALLTQESSAQSPFSARTILVDPTFWMIAALFAIVLSGMKGMVTNLVPLALDEGIEAGAAALLISIFAAAGFVAKLGFAAVADKLSARLLLGGSLVGFAAGSACLIGADAGYWLIAAGVGLIGFFGGFMLPLQSLLIPRIFGQHVVGRVSGLLNLVVLCALLATPPVFGLIFDLTGDYDGIFVVFTALPLFALVMVPIVRLHAKSGSA